MIPPAEQIEAPAALIENGAASEIIASVEEEESKRRGLVGGLARRVAVRLVGSKWVGMRPSKGRHDAHWLPNSPDGAGSRGRSRNLKRLYNRVNFSSISRIYNPSV